MIDHDWAMQFAQEWIAAFNSHDIERVFALCADDITVTSPYIRQRMDVESGVLKGKERVRPYWEKSLSLEPPLLFVLKDVFVGVSTVGVYYESISRKMVCETFTFDANGKVTTLNALHGRPAAPLT